MVFVDHEGFQLKPSDPTAVHSFNILKLLRNKVENLSISDATAKVVDNSIKNPHHSNIHSDESPVFVLAVT